MRPKKRSHHEHLSRHRISHLSSSLGHLRRARFLFKPCKLSRVSPLTRPEQQSTSPDLCPRAKGTHIKNARMSSFPKPDWRMASDRIDEPGVCRVSPPLARLGGQGPVLLVARISCVADAPPPVHGSHAPMVKIRVEPDRAYIHTILTPAGLPCALSWSRQRHPIPSSDAMAVRTMAAEFLPMPWYGLHDPPPYACEAHPGCPPSTASCIQPRAPPRASRPTLHTQ